MTATITEFDRLHRQIGEAAAETRHEFEPQLRRLIDRLRHDNERVPERMKRLHEALLCEAIEAQFENLPV